MPLRLIAAAAAVAALVLLTRFLARLRRDRLVADTPAVRIRSAAQGYVKVSGRALPGGAAAISAPLTGRECVWWSYEIAHQERDSRNNKTWRTVESATSVELFALEDIDGARCLVGPVSAEVTPDIANVWYGSESRPGGEPPAITPLLQFGEWRYTEKLISVGARLSVLGELRSHSATGDAEAARVALLKQWKQEPAQLLARFDANHDGRIDTAEWDSARAEAAHEVATHALSAPIARESVISQPVNGEPFLIAPLTAAALARREERYAALYFVLGLLGIVVCAWALAHAP